MDGQANFNEPSLKTQSKSGKLLPLWLMWGRAYAQQLLLEDSF